MLFETADLSKESAEPNGFLLGISLCLCTALAKAALMKLGNAINLQELEIWFFLKSAAKIFVGHLKAPNWMTPVGTKM